MGRVKSVRFFSSFATLVFVSEAQACRHRTLILACQASQRANLLMVQTNFEVPFGLWETNEVESHHQPASSTSLNQLGSALLQLVGRVAWERWGAVGRPFSKRLQKGFSLPKTPLGCGSVGAIFHIATASTSTPPLRSRQPSRSAWPFCCVGQANQPSKSNEGKQPIKLLR